MCTPITEHTETWALLYGRNNFQRTEPETGCLPAGCVKGCALLGRRTDFWTQDFLSTTQMELCIGKGRVGSGFPTNFGIFCTEAKKKKKTLKIFYFIVFGSNNEKSVNLTLNTLHLMGYVFVQRDLRNPSVSYAFITSIIFRWGIWSTKQTSDLVTSNSSTWS